MAKSAVRKAVRRRTLFGPGTLTMVIRPPDPCPCESGKAAKDCCLRPDGSFRPDPCRLSPPSPKTSFAHPECYARALRDCSAAISGEHYISEAVLDALSNNGMVEVSGFPWVGPGKSKWIPTARMTANILCTRHNSALSPLDTLAARFFKRIWQINEEFPSPIYSCTDRLFLFNGHDLERFLLKWLCGTVASKNASTQSGTIIGWTPPLAWVRTLYGDASFPRGGGLYCDAEIGRRRLSYAGIGFAPISKGSDVYGGIIDLNSFQLTLACVAPPEEKRNTILEYKEYRPVELCFTNGKCKKVLSFYWGGHGQHRTINIGYSKP